MLTLLINQFVEETEKLIIIINADFVIKLNLLILELAKLPVKSVQQSFNRCVELMESPTIILARLLVIELSSSMMDLVEVVTAETLFLIQFVLPLEELTILLVKPNVLVPLLPIVDLVEELLNAVTAVKTGTILFVELVELFSRMLVSPDVRTNLLILMEIV